MVNITPNFPNVYINLQDDSATTVPDTTILPVHLPLFITFAETGPVGVPFLGASNAIQATYGTQLLNPRSAYYNHQSVFLANALPFQQVMYVRVCDPAAVAASLVLLCTVTPTAAIPQYVRTSGGALVLTNGNPTQITGAGSTAPGVTLTFSVRALTSQETVSTVATTTATVSGGLATTYPIMAFATTPGAGGNNYGFRLFYNSSFDTTAVANTGSMLYSFQPVELDTTTNIEDPIYDIYNDQTQTFSFLKTAYDPTTATFYDLHDVITNDYNGLPGLPYNYHVYGTNVGAIGSAIIAVSPELSGTNPYLINFMTCVDGNGNTYEHAIVDSTGPMILNSNVVNYLKGGTDGSTSNATYEEQVIAFLSGSTYPQISDNFRYPFTHFYDSGFTLATKEAILALYALRDDVKITFSTQDVSLAANTAALDQSTGSALRAMVILNPESTEFGTQFCRADIYQQCGTLANSSTYTTIVPATLDRMLKRCKYGSGQYINGEPKGRPNSEVTIFNLSSVNWTPTTSQQKQLSWNTALNYFQFADVNTLFYPDLITVYPTLTSLLSNDCFVDYAAVYLKQIIRQQWTNFSGLTTPPANLYTQIANAIDQKAAYVFNGLITTSTVVSQTAVDTQLGYQITVTTTVTGNMPDRVWQVVVPITRASSSSTSTTA